jgi:hypothetical protein
MFSLTTTLFYMLSAYIAFLIGSSAELPDYLIVLVPLGFVVGYLLDRLNSVKSLWADNRIQLLNLVVTRYFFFLFIAAVFYIAGLIFSDYLFEG